jgi:hypothetical protein
VKQKFLGVQHGALAFLRFEFGLGAAEVSARSSHVGFTAG